jgi:hypothetical protein
MITPMFVEIGEPESEPGKIVEPVHDPVPRENPKPVPVEPSPRREKVPA